MLVDVRPSNEALLILQLPHRERANRLSLRASDEHSFIVRVLRARRMVDCSLASFSGRAFREHRTNVSGTLPTPFAPLNQSYRSDR